MRSGRTRLDGAIDVVAALLDGGVTTVEGVHAAIARQSFASLRFLPVVGDVAAVVDEIQHAMTSVVYGMIRAAVTLSGGGARVAASLTPSVTLAHDPSPRRETRGEPLVAILNRFAGEHLARAGNPLGTTMGVVHRGRTIALDRGSLAAAFPRATPRLAVFVHGLAGDEEWWRRDAERHYGDPHASYGSRLERDLGYTPLYVRYNS